jgi:hypothetical protein
MPCIKTNTNTSAIHTSEEWESIRGLFSTLYETQNKPLKEIRAMLAREHSFFATLRFHPILLAHANPVQGAYV